MKKHWKIGASVALLAGVVASCGGSGDGGDSGAMKELGAGEGQVNLIAWGGYVEDGSTDPAVDWVSGFEAETGCEVNVKVGNTSDEMVTLMQSGEYDGVSASGDASLRLIAAGEVSPVNTDLIPNYADVFSGLKDRQWNSKDGVSYGVPHGRGANVLVYNTESGPAPTSINDMFDADSPWAGKISVYDAPIYIADAAIYLMANQPDLGIENPYALDQEQFDAAIELLKAQKEIVGQYWALYTDQQAALESGTVTLGTSWQVIVNLAQGNDAPIEAVKAAEGATGWSDTWMISSKAKHPNCMYMWMNHIISPEANAAVAEWFWRGTVQRQVVRADRRSQPLRRVPRRRRDLLRGRLVLDDPDQGVPRRAHRRGLRSVHGVGQRLERDPRLTR